MDHPLLSAWSQPPSQADKLLHPHHRYSGTKSSLIPDARLSLSLFLSPCPRLSKRFTTSLDDGSLDGTSSSSLTNILLQGLSNNRPLLFYLNFLHLEGDRRDSVDDRCIIFLIRQRWRVTKRSRTVKSTILRLMFRFKTREGTNGGEFYYYYSTDALFLLRKLRNIGFIINITKRNIP